MTTCWHDKHFIPESVLVEHSRVLQSFIESTTNGAVYVYILKTTSLSYNINLSHWHGKLKKLTLRRLRTSFFTGRKRRSWGGVALHWLRNQIRRLALQDSKPGQSQEIDLAHQSIISWRVILWGLHWQFKAESRIDIWKIRTRYLYHKRANANRSGKKNSRSNPKVFLISSLLKSMHHKT